MLKTIILLSCLLVCFSVALEQRDKILLSDWQLYSNDIFDKPKYNTTSNKAPQKRLKKLVKDNKVSANKKSKNVSALAPKEKEEI